MAYTNRYGERAVEAMGDYLTDATNGLDARCTAINATITDGVTLPTNWTLQKDMRARNLTFPLVSAWASSWKYHGERRRNAGEVDVQMTVVAAMSLFTTDRDPDKEEALLYRVGRALWEILTDEDPTYSGPTLGNATGVLDVRINDTAIRAVPHKGTGRRSVWIELNCTVKVYEDMGRN